MELPNPDPRPEGEVRELERIWATPRGWRLVTAVNNTVIGLLYLGVAFLFFLMAGLLAVVMRTQLALGDNRLVDQDLYNQMFTVHGTTMMFLFAVPAVEALGVMLLPQMLAARDLPFPRLSAFAIWAYVVGGLVFFSTIFYDLAPKGGWFMYPPLTLMEYSPGDNADFWLLGIGFIEISAIAGAVEIVVGALRTRPPGMSLAKMPIFAWTMLIFASMIMFAFPACPGDDDAGDRAGVRMALLHRRTRGRSAALAASLLFFGHPEVYIIFLPAAGLVSMMVPTMARTPLVGYHLIVVALIGTGFFSFGLWVHHMFTTGIPALSLAFFSAASMAVAVPSGIQVFSWIATIAAGRERFRITTASLFILGFLFIFTLGGLTGVMVAMVPFDHQVHDTYFVVAHFHYVLIGGFVFPLFAAIYYWMPLFSRRMLSERLGRWVFWLIFIGFNVTFLPMHLTGLRGMPRRVWTYPGEMGWDTLNLISTVGTYVLAVGVLVFLVDLAAKFRLGNGPQENPWGAGTLEWLPNDVYSTRSIPHITSREPLWDRPSLPQEVRDGHHYLPNAPTGWRNDRDLADPCPSAICHPDARSRLAAFPRGRLYGRVLLLLTVKMVTIATVCGVLAIAFILVWAWGLDPGPSKGMIEIAKGVRLPTYMSGPTSHSWWAMVVLMFVAASLYLAYVFSYLFLWVVSPEVWAPIGSPEPPPLGWPLGSAALLLAGSGILWLVSRRLGVFSASRVAMSVALLLSLACLTGAFALELRGHLATGLSPEGNAYGAMVYLGAVLFAQLVFALVIMGLFAMARHLAGKLDAVRRVTYDSYALLYHYTVAQSLLGLGLIHGFPRLIG